MAQKRSPKSAAKEKKPYARTRPNTKKRSRNRAAFSIPEAAAYTGFGIIAMRELVRIGDIPSFKVGNKTYVLKSALDAWLQKRGNPAAA